MKLMEEKIILLNKFFLRRLYKYGVVSALPKIIVNIKLERVSHVFYQ